MIILSFFSGFSNAIYVFVYFITIKISSIDGVYHVIIKIGGINGENLYSSFFA